MTIAFVNNNLTGLIHFRLDVMMHFAECGYKVVAIAPSDNQLQGDVPDEITFIPVELARTSTNPVSDLKFFLSLRRILGEVKPDYVFFYTIKPNIYGTFAARSLGIHSSMMMAGLGYTFSNNNMASRLARQLYKLVIKLSDSVMLLNQSNYDTLVQMKICDNEKFVLLKGGEGVNLDRYQCQSNDSEVSKFLFVGRLLREKGIFDFVEAAKLVKQRKLEAQFLVAGGLDEAFPDSMTQAELDALVKDGVIKYLGTVDMTKLLMQSGIVIAIPSYYSEGLNRSLMEGCATSKPIITTTQPGCKETVKDGVNGFLVPVRDPKALADAMLRYLNLDKESKVRMAFESRRMAETLFDVRDVIKVYDCLVQRFIETNLGQNLG